MTRKSRIWRRVSTLKRTRQMMRREKNVGKSICLIRRLSELNEENVFDRGWKGGQKSGRYIRCRGEQKGKRGP